MDSEHQAAKESIGKRTLGTAASIIGVIGGIALGRYFGLAFFIIAAILIVPYWFGKKYASWYVRRSPNVRWVEILSWSNILTWLIPPLGMLTSAATLELNKHNHSQKKKYQTLAMLGLILGIANSFIGAYLRFKAT